jgi:hypothetical protein
MIRPVAKIPHNTATPTITGVHVHVIGHLGKRETDELFPLAAV